MENIRSYTKTETPILFPEGITLFKGDIRAGKSTLLYAIEFALFGLGEYNGNYLLRNGEETGSVSLEFKSNGVDYKITRNLVRKKDQVVQDDECYFEIASENIQEVLSPTELKERVIQVLGINDSTNPRSRNLVYRYAIFTPQEEMKSILNSSDKERLETIRRALRIDEYKTAIDNVTHFAKLLEQRTELLKVEIKGFDRKCNDFKDIIQKLNQDQSIYYSLSHEDSTLKVNLEKVIEIKKEKEEEKEKLEQVAKEKEIIKARLEENLRTYNNNNEELSKLHNQIIKIEEQISKKRKTLSIVSEKELKIQKDQILKNLDLYREQQRTTSGIKDQIPLLQSQISRIESQIAKLNIMIKSKNNEINKYKTVLRDNSNLTSPSDKPIEKLQEEFVKLNELINEKENYKSKIQERLSNYRILVEKGECQTCGSIVSKDFKYRFKQLNDEYKELVTSLERYRRDSKECNNKIEKFREYNNKLKEVSEAKEKHTSVDNEIKDLSKSVTNLEEEKSAIKNEIDQKQKELVKKGNLEKDIDRLKKEKEKIEYQERIFEEINKLENSKVTYNDLVDKLAAKSKTSKEAVDELKSKIEEKEKLLHPLPSVISILKETDEQIDLINEKIKSINNRKIETEITVKYNNQRKDELKKEIQELKGKDNKRKVIEQYYNWFDQYYINAIQEIEIHVLELRRNQFYTYFQEWFKTLLDDLSLRIEIDEWFSPKINRSNSVQDYAQLSGGERTSIALAYRLALNTLVREISFENHINLLILDEPTEGFSKEQLFKLRTVLNQISCKQIIIVSHEQELDGLADHIFQVENNYGVSQVNTN